jgi:hypothetical protein
VKEESAGGEACYVIDVTPKDAAIGKEEGYSKKTYWVSKTTFSVRKGVFYMCTRAAYQEDFATRILHQTQAPPAADDGVPLGGANFGERLLAYLNRGQPLRACGNCRGSEGSTAPHAQLSRADVREGRLRRGPAK